jgi:hypothetical protein
LQDEDKEERRKRVRKKKENMEKGNKLFFINYINRIIIG